MVRSNEKRGCIESTRMEKLVLFFLVNILPAYKGLYEL